MVTNYFDPVIIPETQFRGRIAMNKESVPAVYLSQPRI